MKKLTYKIKQFGKNCVRLVSKCKFFLCHHVYKPLKNINYDNAEQQILKIYTPTAQITHHNQSFKYDVSLDLSIIVPVYNVKNYLPKCIESLIQTTSYSYEIILIDDGSSDGSSDICDKYAQKYNFIKVIHQNNKGVSSSRNNGIINSRGRYILFVDSDDYLLSHTLNTINLSSLDYDIIQFRHQVSNNNKTILKSQKFSKNNTKILNLYYGYMWNKFYKREIFKNIKNTVGYWFEDMINDLIIFPTYKNILTSNQITYSYTINDNGITSTSRHSHKILDAYFVLKEIISHIDDYKINYTAEHFKRLLYQASSQIYARIRKQNINVVKQCFVLLCQLVNSTMKKYSISTDCFNKFEKCLVKAFKTQNFSLWKNISEFYE